jgi:hypothetical protein
MMITANVQNVPPCVDCDSPAQVVLSDCCENYYGTHLCYNCVDRNTCSCCTTELEPI